MGGHVLRRALHAVPYVPYVPLINRYSRGFSWRSIAWVCSSASLSITLALLPSYVAALVTVCETLYVFIPHFACDGMNFEVCVSVGWGMQ